ncbi:MAG: sulfotransferase family protein [gamma proteobacterium endosymbiont of Lamellibrachia anaximandri]|nr:sulfotransferase family protein [gamma proteobacterium endosymbiont of Lamellibrachia anaximandri]
MSKKKKPAVQSTDILVSAIDEALALLKQSSYGEKAMHTYRDDPGSLLEQCIALCEKNKARKPEPIRTIHHFACTGGTLFGKCLAVMPNTQLLSEVDPLSTLGINDNSKKFAPTDMITLMRQSTSGGNKELIIEMFLNNIEIIYASALQMGKRLILRDHAHSHFCVGNVIPERQNLRQILMRRLPVLSVVTVREPIDSYLSLVNNKWVNFSPPTFDEYCRRYLIFIDSYHDVPIIKYEDFVVSPYESMDALCNLLDIPYSDQFIDLFNVINLTGDSGRSSGEIMARPRRVINKNLRQEVSESLNYEKIRNVLKYDCNNSF